MLKSYFLTSFRSLLRHRLFSVLNIIGLAIGMAVSFLILHYVWDQLSYDKFHTDNDRIYRVVHDFYRDGQLDFESAKTYPKVGPVLSDDFEGVENYCRIFTKYRGGVVQYEDRNFKEHNLMYADASFFNIFSYALLKGDKATALKNVHTAIIEEKTALKYFGTEDPIGRRIKVGSMDGTEEFEITGVLQTPVNSHLEFTFVFSYPSLVSLYGEDANASWGWYDFLTYIKLKQGVNAAQLEAKLPEMVDKYGGERLGSKRVKLTLQPVTSIHLHSHRMMEAFPNNEARTVYFLLIIAIAILLIAWINYINLSTARAIERAKEVGMRKVMGSSRFQLAGQFVMEALLINFLAIIAALLIMYMMLPFFNQITGKTFDGTIFLNSLFWGIVVTIFLIGSCIAGSYPAFILSSYQPSRVLQGQLKNSNDGILLRKCLVTGQFMASIVMIAGTLTVHEQLQYMQSQDLRVELDQVFVIKAPDVINDRDQYYRSLEVFKSELLKDERVKNVTISSDVPGKQVGWYNSARRTNTAPQANTILYTLTFDNDYFQTLHINLLAGRQFARESRYDSSNIILNAKAVQQLGFRSPEEALLEKIIIRRDTMTIIGVVENYFHDSPKEQVKPTAYLLVLEERTYLSVKFEVSSATAIIEKSKALYSQMYPGIPFDHFLLSDYYQAQYKQETKFMQSFTFFSVLAILVASLGLFGLASFSVAQRMKEVGIRKVLGSSGTQIFLLFVKSFGKLVIMANILAIPLILFVMNSWLNSFAKRITIGTDIFIVTTVITILIALFSISYQVLQAAFINPAKIIRNE